MADQIPFTRGVPSADLLPVDDLRAAAETAFADPTALSYGSGAGHAGLRAWIAARHATDPDRVLCANGSLQAFAFLSDVLLDGATGRRVLVEAPTYDRSILILRRTGAEVVGVPQDADGLDVEALAADVERNGPPAFAYVIPNFQNPSGATLTLERRRALVALAAERGFLLVEDDPYGLLRWRGERLPTLHELDGGDNVVTMSSFTKTIAPGLRAGYAVSPPELARRLSTYATNTQISPCMLSHATIAAYCAAGRFEPNVERATAELERRCAAMAGALAEHFPADARYAVPDGGYFMWVELPGTDTSALLEQAAAAGVPYVRGADFYGDGGGTSALRLAFSAVPPGRIREGIERLGRVIAAA
jgi:2-aminoadipate transaminase